MDQVRTLFDAKAARWPEKYAAGGRLAGRLARLAGATGGLIAAGGDLLDLGCGSGELARQLAGAGYRVTGCDIAPEMLSAAAAADEGQAVRWIRLEPRWRALPLSARSVDAVVAASLLEYVHDPSAVLAECARVLRPGGVLLCTVPNLAHPVRWLEWPLVLAARTAPGPIARCAPHRAGQYLAYLRTSRQRRPVRWWHAAGRQAGLEPAAVPTPAFGPTALGPTALGSTALGSTARPPRTRGAPREPLRLLAFTRSAGGRVDTRGGQ